MYVRITKGSGWYKGLEGDIYNVELCSSENKYYTLPKSDDMAYIRHEDCEEINLDFDGKISEEFADKLLEETWFNKRYGVNTELTKEKWKEKGYIKHSREDELRESLDCLKPYDSLNLSGLKNMNRLQNELIQILDNKLNNTGGK